MGKDSNHKMESNDIVGVWRVKEIGRQGGSEPIFDESLPSIIVFTSNHYSMVWAFGKVPQRFFTRRWKPTDAEKIERFDSLVVNAGTYETEGNTLIAHPVVARIPEFMGGKFICEYHVERDSMILKFVDEYSFDGVQAPWVAGGGITLTLVRAE